MSDTKSTWERLDWEVLDRLRATFLSDERTAGPYWHTITDLETYDLTFGERIGWKWDAVLRELRARPWSPPPGDMLDWGCGSGVASRRVLRAFGAENFARLVLHDHSPLAVEYAEHRARREFPGLAVERASVRFLRGNEPLGLLVVSHVLNELDDNGRAELGELLSRAQSVLWVEPGTHEVSRAMLPYRAQALASGAQVIAPCPHALTCGLLLPGNERHWCHFFADPPPGLHADSDWVKFAQRAGIDLRALPYSYLVLDRREAATAQRAAAPSAPPATSTVDRTSAPDHQSPIADHQTVRFLGHPRLYKGYAKLFTCTSDGVRELTLQKRDAPEHFKSLKRGEPLPPSPWIIEGDRLRPAE